MPILLYAHFLLYQWSKWVNITNNQNYITWNVLKSIFKGCKKFWTSLALPLARFSYHPILIIAIVHIYWFANWHLVPSSYQFDIVNVYNITSNWKISAHIQIPLKDLVSKMKMKKPKNQVRRQSILRGFLICKIRLNRPLCPNLWGGWKHSNYYEFLW